MCFPVSTTTTLARETCEKIFKFRNSCDYEKVLRILDCKISCAAPYAGDINTNVFYRFINCKRKHRAFDKCNQRTPQKRFQNHCCLDGHTNIKE